MASANEVLSFPDSWNVPFRRNPYFTGRDNVLLTLHDTLTSGKKAALTQPQAINGLGGIGKTQIAVEFAYRYCDKYKAILWTRADSDEVLISDFVNIAHLLDLPQKDVQDQNLVVIAVKRWLQTNKDWLLILDNVEDLEMINNFLPTMTAGHILLTTRIQATGTFAQPVEIEKMEREEGATFLLRRARLIKPQATLEDAPEANRSKAKEISQAMDGLPLALDQAGAYIEETKCGLSHYFALYQEKRAELLKKRGRMISSHPESVTTTFSLSLEKVEIANPAAAELLRLFAFLHSDDIPEEIISEGASEIVSKFEPFATDSTKLDEAIGELLKYSLIKRNADSNLISIHRLVQAVIKDEMKKASKKRWAEIAVYAVSNIFPTFAYTSWSQCQRYILQTQACADMIKQWNIISTTAIKLLHNAADFLQKSALYTEAEALYKQSLDIIQKTFGSENSYFTKQLNALGLLYKAQGKYDLSELCFKRALAIAERIKEPASSKVYYIHNLAQLYDDQGKYIQAEALFKRALVILNKAFGEMHPDIAICLDSLAALYTHQGKYTEAEKLYRQAQTIWEKVVDLGHPDLATNLNNLAVLYHEQGKNELAESLLRRVLDIRERFFGPNHPDVANVLNQLASVYLDQERYVEAESLHQRQLAIYQSTFGPKHPEVARCFNNIALLYHRQKKFERAELLYKQAEAIWEEILEPNHPDIATNLNNQGGLYNDQGMYEQAEQYYQRALTMIEQTQGPNSRSVIEVLNNLASVYHEQKKYDQAKLLYRRSLATSKKILGTEHPTTVTISNNYSLLLAKTNQKKKTIKIKTARAKHPKGHLVEQIGD
jgi:tetratricopeptide (TPR) repeat protein